MVFIIEPLLDWSLPHAMSVLGFGGFLAGLQEIRQLRKSYKFPTLRNPELKCV